MKYQSTIRRNPDWPALLVIFRFPPLLAPGFKHIFLSFFRKKIGQSR